jgi:tetratricopeptide (TPR) repeat protein
VTPATGPAHKGANHFLLGWLVPAVILILSLSVVWSNHFGNGFHADDQSTIVNNRAIRSLSEIPRFFTHPGAFSTAPESADYKPLLLTSFALDAALTGTGNPVVYQMDSFIWFALLIFSLYLLFRLIPGANDKIAFFGAALFGLHPIAAETVNYIVQRGQIMGAAGVSLALAFWIVFPRRMPKRLGFDLNRVPQSWLQSQIRLKGASWERAYQDFLRLPIPFYLVPLLPALLAEPSAAVFVLLAFAYRRLFEPEEGYRRLVLPAIVCGVYWVAQTLWVFTLSPLLRVPFLAWWWTQPWIVMRYLGRFLWPWGISADSGIGPLHLMQLSAFAGVAGLVLLVCCAVAAGRREKFRGVAFGLWWFLISLAPTLLVPQRAVEANSRMFLGAAGLAFAIASLGGIWLNEIEAMESKRSARMVGLAALSAIGLTILTGESLLTYARNQVWESEKTLWLDVTEKNPDNGRGYLEYASALLADSDDAEALPYLEKAEPLAGNDGLLQLRLAMGFDRMNKDAKAEAHFREAIRLAPRFSAVYSSYGKWLLLHQRTKEAAAMASKALELNPADLISRHTLMDLYSAKSDWATVARLANEVLALDPTDPEGKRSQTVAAAVMDQMKQAEADVKNSPTPDDYLKLSVLYFHNQRYEDCVKASREALRLRPDLAEAYANMAVALHTMGRNDEAMTALREVIRLRPDMEFAKKDLAILLALKEHPDSK